MRTAAQILTDYRAAQQHHADTFHAVRKATRTALRTTHDDDWGTVAELEEELAAATDELEALVKEAAEEDLAELDS